MRVTIGPNGLVESISFPGPLRLQGWVYHAAVDHEERARRWLEEGVALASAIVVAEPVAEEHGDDPTFIRQEHLLCVSEVEEEARRRMQNRYYSDDELRAIFETEGFPDRHNRMILTRELPSFHAVAHDLTGNYPADWRQTKHLFEGKLLVPDYNASRLMPEPGIS